MAGRPRRDSTIDRRFQENLRRFREAKGWNQEDLGNRLNRAPSYVSMLETGIRGASGKMVDRLAKILEVDPGTFFVVEERRTPVRAFFRELPPEAIESLRTGRYTKVRRHFENIVKAEFFEEHP